jgi:hypothetical protein
MRTHWLRASTLSTSHLPAHASMRCLGLQIDLTYGVVLAVIFVRLCPSLPGDTRVTKGLSFGLLVWLLRVVMSAAGEWVTKTTPPATHAYVLLTGLVQIAVVSVFLGALLTPRPGAGPVPWRRECG